jgi:hypothetical protein
MISGTKFIPCLCGVFVFPVRMPADRDSTSISSKKDRLVFTLAGERVGPLKIKKHAIV